MADYSPGGRPELPVCVRLSVLSVSVICRRTRDVTKHQEDVETKAELVPGALDEGPLWVWLRFWMLLYKLQ